ncbi:hypothetical protein [Bradyrhizobium diazoefficiens]|uniref:hypothetical protein n=1 Tax=Bradyrhizobium diazoefficiens TaxID=1355477 RepID=UPI0038323E23
MLAVSSIGTFGFTKLEIHRALRRGAKCNPTFCSDNETVLGTFLTAAPDGTGQAEEASCSLRGKSNSAVRIVFSGESPGRGKKPFKKNLAGALAAEGVSGRAGAVALTSRISVEMVQRIAAIGAHHRNFSACRARNTDGCNANSWSASQADANRVFSHFAGIL